MLIGMKKGATVKIVIDANWYISACIHRKSRHTLYRRVLRNVDVRVYYSDELMAEFDKVICRSKFRKYVTQPQAIRLKNFTLQLIRRAHINAQPSVVRDSCDNYLLGLCESCRAHFLVTGDDDLLVLNRHRNTSILCMNKFLQIIAS